MEFSKIVELIHAVSEAGLSEFQMQEGNLNISMSANRSVVAESTVAANRPIESAQASLQPPKQPPLAEASGNTVKSPLVGTFYAAASPESAPFVKVGERVTKGQVLGIVEAMKLMNEIESEFDGTVREILVKNEQMVEFGQPMFVIE